MPDLLVTTSWDDGHPADERLADLLGRHGMGATFYVPLRNGEGRAVMTPSQIRQLDAAGFEIGSHTADHVRLSALSDQAVTDQIRQGKAGLEDCLGHPVTGFCLPGGRGGARVRALAARAGVTAIRTVEMFRLDPGADPMAMPTTLQLFPHPKSALLRNLLRRRIDGGRLGLCLGCLRVAGLEAQLDWVLDRALQRGGVLHLWGHSWEVEDLGLWPLLDRFFGRVAEQVPRTNRVTTAVVAGRMRA